MQHGIYLFSLLVATGVDLRPVYSSSKRLLWAALHSVPAGWHSLFPCPWPEPGPLPLPTVCQGLGKEHEELQVENQHLRRMLQKRDEKVTNELSMREEVGHG